MKTPVWFYLLCTFFIIVESSEIISMVSSIVEFYGKNTMISAFLCDKKERAAFVKHFSRNNHQINILPLTESSLFHPVPPNSVIFIVNLKCPNVGRLLIKADRAKLYAWPFKWLAYYDGEQDMINIVEEYFSNITILTDSDVMVAAKMKTHSFTIAKIFKRQLHNLYLREMMGTWTKSEGFINELSLKISSRRRRDLKGITLTSSMVLANNNSIHHLTDKRHAHIDTIPKLNYPLVEHLSDIVNVSLKYSIQKTWGYKDTNSKWNGMVGELIRHEADIGGTASLIIRDRLPVIDYIAMTTAARGQFIFRQPKLSYVTNLYTLPFDGFVWASVIILFLIMAALLYVIVNWDFKKQTYVEMKNGSSEIHGSWSDVLMITFGALCQQGASWIPVSPAGRVAIFISFLSLMFLYTAYSANIVALLQSSSDSIQTLEDLLNSKLEVGVEDTPYNRFFFKHEAEPIRRALYERKVAPPGQRPKFYPPEYGIKRVRGGLYAYFGGAGSTYKFIRDSFEESEKADLKEISYYQNSNLWITAQKNSSFKELFKVGLLQLREKGIQAREVNLIYPKRPEGSAQGGTFVSVGMMDYYPVLVVVAAGFIISVVLLIVEILTSRRD